MAAEQKPQQLDLGLVAPIALDEKAKATILTEAGFTAETTDPDAHLVRQPPIRENIFVAADARTLWNIGEQLADILKKF